MKMLLQTRLFTTRNRILLYKNIWLGSTSDHGVVFTVFAAFTIFQCYFTYFFSPLLQTRIINLLSTTLFLYNYIRGITTEPGVVCRSDIEALELTKERADSSAPRNTKEDPASYYQHRKCSLCKLVQPPKATHCYMCNHCVKELDHHCNFMANCIGLRNLRYFIGWLYSMLFQGLVWYTTVIPYFFATFDFALIKELVYHDFAMQIAVGGAFLSICCFQCSSRSCNSILTIFLFSFVLVVLIKLYRAGDSFHTSMACPIIFVVCTMPLAIWTLAMSVSSSYMLARGVSMKESAVMFRIGDSRQASIRTLFLRLQEMIEQPVEESEIE